MLLLVSSAAINLAFTSAALALVLASTEMSSSSSSKSPELLVRRSSRLASNCIRDLVLAFTSSNTWLSCSSSAFCSLPMTFPRSCSSSPFCVTVKSINVVLACNSGLKLGLGKRVMKYIMKFLSKSMSLSLTLINILEPLRIICFSMTGSNMGSISSSTPTITRLLPSLIQNSNLSLSLGSDKFTKFCPFQVGKFSDSLLRIQFRA
mmetsp:Transcript_6223/g.7837  ORF Transcript_6223/g.7837 Transcript_6223/m.7837 type:complete len:206 (-) Transcript_6223:7791-8408(-)